MLASLDVRLEGVTILVDEMQNNELDQYVLMCRVVDVVVYW